MTKDLLGLGFTSWWNLTWRIPFIVLWKCPWWVINLILGILFILSVFMLRGKRQGIASWDILMHGVPNYFGIDPDKVDVFKINLN